MPAAAAAEGHHIAAWTVVQLAAPLKAEGAVGTEFELHWQESWRVLVRLSRPEETVVGIDVLVDVTRTKRNAYVRGPWPGLGYKETWAVAFAPRHIAGMARLEGAIEIEVLDTADTAIEEVEGSNQCTLLAAAAEAEVMHCCLHCPNGCSVS